LSFVAFPLLLFLCRTFIPVCLWFFLIHAFTSFLVLYLDPISIPVPILVIAECGLWFCPLMAMAEEQLVDKAEI
jgi:hypothetical protein